MFLKSISIKFYRKEKIKNFNYKSSKIKRIFQSENYIFLKSISNTEKKSDVWQIYSNL